ncbi:flagellin [Actibacterium sp. XHP0104]|uniref:flagellin n=1 Tax=Actibacterium sp. XHP0104 TaxID=2984335 RepID=UPI0021E8EB64|nr:flagellin [Actibacterium sp. XHP0104]MCV2881823.1 flagellin [Actibacterium sp. XHP0104]
MKQLTLGDQSQSVLLARHNLALKTRMTTLVQEVTTGTVADQGRHLAGDFSALSAIERSLTMLKTYDRNAAEAAGMARMMQAGLGSLGQMAMQTAEDMLLVGGTPSAGSLDTAGATAAARFDSAVAALNIKYAGRSLFAGTATDSPAIAPASAIMAALSTAVSGAGTAQDVAQVIDLWFDTPGGGFDTVAYQGATAPMGGLPVGEGQRITLSVTAVDPEIRGMLKAMATAALLADETVLAGDPVERGRLAVMAGEGLQSAQSPLTTLQARIGDAEAGIETIQAENAARSHAFQIARTDLIGADPYETATRLDQVQTRLETLYTLTARMSRLTLADYLS